MSLFRSKKAKEPIVSAFDQIPEDAQAKLVEDVISIVRTLKEWPNIIPKELHQHLGNELQGMLRKSLSKLIPMFMSDSDVNFGEAFKGLQLPLFLSQAFHAVKLGLKSDTLSPAPEDPNGKAA